MDTQSPLISPGRCLAQPRWQRVGTSPMWWLVPTGAELPCKYPRFTRFITSLAVKFATSSMEHIGEAQTETERERQVSKQWRGGHAGTAEWVQGSGQLHADTVHAGTVVASTSHLRSKSVAKENLALLCQALACGGRGLQRLRGTQGRCQF